MRNPEHWLEAFLLVYLSVGTSFGAVSKTAAFWISGPVDPGGMVMVTGQFAPSSEVSVKITSLSDDGSTWSSNVDRQGKAVKVARQNEHAVMFELPTGSDDVYGFRIDQIGQEAIYGRVNLPEAWWTLSQAPPLSGLISGQITENQGVKSGTLEVFGRCFVHRGRPDSIQLVSKSGAHFRLNTKLVSPYSLSGVIPSDIPSGTYDLFVGAQPFHEGTQSHALRFEINDYSVTTLRNVNLQKYGAIGDGTFDNSRCLESAIADAVKIQPATVSVPSGIYLLTKPVEIPPGIYLIGISSQSTAILFPDVDRPPAAWIFGKNTFGLANISVYCGNHRALIASDRSGSPSQSGHIRLNNVLLQGNAFSGHIKPTEMTDRSADLLKGLAAGFEALFLSGPDIEITNCDIQGSGQSLNLFRAHAAIIRKNKFRNGRFGSYGFGGCEEIDFSENEIEGKDLSSYGGSYSVSRNAKVSRNIYTALNKYSEFRGWDSEAFTSDGGGGAYFGNVLSSTGTSIQLKADPNWEDLDWQGTLVAITGGRGMGQWRLLDKWNGRLVNVSESFQIPPDDTSTLTIVPLQAHYVFYKNEALDAGIAIQFFGAGVEHIAADNSSTRAGGLRVFTLTYFNGVQPQINVQLLGNQISGFGYKNSQPGLRPTMTVSVLEAESHPPSTIMGLVIRNNQLGENCLFLLRSWSRAGMRNVLLENNQLAGGPSHLRVDDVIQPEVLAK